MKPTAIVCDIDGVLCDSDARYKTLNFEDYQNGNFRDFFNALKACNEASTEDDIPIDLGIALLSGLDLKLKPDHVIYLTARNNMSRTQTENWLKSNDMLLSKKESLVMKDNDFTSKKFRWDHTYKKQACKDLQQEYNILIAIDDKISNCEAFESLGIPYIHFKIPKGERDENIA